MENQEILYNEEEIRKLNEIIANKDNTNTLRNRAAILIDLMEKKTVSEIVSSRFVSAPTVKNVRKAYLEKGLEGIFPKDRKKAAQVSYRATYNCSTGLKSDQMEIVGLYLNNYEGMFIYEEKGDIQLAYTGAAEIEIRGKNAVTLAEQAVIGSDMNLETAIYIATLTVYKAADGMVESWQFYYDFIKKAMHPGGKYTLLYFSEVPSLYDIGPLSPFNNNRQQNVNVVEYKSRKKWLQRVTDLIKTMENAEPQRDARKVLPEQISLFTGAHNKESCPFIWLQSKPVIESTVFTTENDVIPEGVSELPDIYHIKYPMHQDHVEMGKAYLFSCAILIDKSKGKYSILSVKNSDYIDNPFGTGRTTRVDLQMLIDKVDGMLSTWKKGLEPKIYNMLKDALKSGLSTDFDEELDTNYLIEQLINLTPFRKMDDNSAALVVCWSFVYSDRKEELHVSQFSDRVNLVSPTMARQDKATLDTYCSYLGKVDDFTAPVVKKVFQSLFKI